MPSDRPQLSPVWLTEVLRQSGALRRARVLSMGFERMGTFSSELLRLHLIYDRQEPGAPASLVLKYPRADPRERPGYGFATEIGFYRDIAHRVPVRTPRFHYGSLYGPTGLALLLLEDVQGLTPISWEGGVTDTHAHLALESLARLHAQWWDRVDDLDGLPSLADPAFRVEIAEAYDRGWRASREYFRATSSDSFVAIGDAVLGQVAETLAPLACPPTLLHGDAHFENLSLVDGGDEMIFLDWPGARRGHASFDVAVFMVQSFPVDARRRVEEAFVAAHADAVRAAGVAGWSDPWLDYRRGVLYWVVHMLQNATHRPGDPPWVVTDRYTAAAVDLRVGDLIR